MENVIYIMCGILGVMLQVTLDVQSLKKSAKAANMQFIFKKFLEDDWPTIAGSIITVIIFTLILPEIVAVKPSALNYSRFGFVFIGYTGSSIIQMLFSATSKKINSVIDLKSNIADNTVSPVTPENISAVPEVIKGDTTETKE